MAKKLIDLTGATVTVPAGWTASLGYGKFSIGFCDLNSTSWLTGECTDLEIGNEENKITFIDTWGGGGEEGEGSYNVIVYDNSHELHFEFWDFTDSWVKDNTNPLLIQWFVDNNATIEGGVWEEVEEEIPSIEYEVVYNDVVIATFKKGQSITVKCANKKMLSDVILRPKEQVFIPTDLTGYIVAVPAGWKATAGYGQFSINTAFYGYYCTGAEHVKFSVGYEAFEGIFMPGMDCEYEAKDNHASFASDFGEACNNTSDNGFVFLVEDGTDVTNPELISWLSSNDAIFDKQETMIIFGQGGMSQYVAKIGMTWEEFINSVYNIENITIDENNNIRWYEHIVENEDGTLVKPTDVIDKTEYNLVGGSD